MNRLSPLDEIQLRQRHDPITIEARLETEVISGERLDCAQSCCL
jgi:hypothetical protein